MLVRHEGVDRAAAEAGDLFANAGAFLDRQFAGVEGLCSWLMLPPAELQAGHRDVAGQRADAGDPGVQRRVVVQRQAAFGARAR